MTLTLILVDPTVPAAYDVSAFHNGPNLTDLAEEIEASGLADTFTVKLKSYALGPGTIPVAPQTGQYIVFGDDNAYPGNPDPWRYDFIGEIQTPPTSIRVDSNAYELQCVSFLHELNQPVPAFTANGTDQPDDRSRLAALFASLDFRVLWNATDLVGGPFVSFPADEVTTYRGLLHDQIDQIATADPQGLGVAARRWHVSAAWTDPDDYTAGVTRYLNYYGATGATMDPTPLTDAQDGTADWFADTFTRGNSSTSLGAAETGQDWQVFAGTWGTNSNRAYLPAGGADNLATAPGTTADGVVQATLVTIATDVGLAVRCDADTGGHIWKGWIWIAQAASNRYGLYKRQAGNYGLIATLAVTPANGDVLKVTLSGNSIIAEVIRGGVSQGTASTSDSFQAGGLMHGLVAVSLQTAARWDAFTIHGAATRYWDLLATPDGSQLANILMIAGPDVEPTPAEWQTATDPAPPTNVTTAAGSVQKAGATTAWDAGASSVLALGDEGGEVVWSTEARQIAADTFSRANSSQFLGKAETGQDWETENSAYVWGITGGRAYAATLGASGNGLAVVECGAASVIVEVTLSALALSAGRVVFRETDQNNYLFVQPETGAYKLYKRVAGSLTLLGSYSTTPAAGDVIKISAEESGITVYLNGTVRITATETFNQTATRHGFAVTSGGAAARWDNWSVRQSYATRTVGLATGTLSGDADAYDSFDRADNVSIGTADSGQTWATHSASAYAFGVLSNQAYPSTLGASAAGVTLLAAGVSDGVVEAVFAALDLGHQWLVARATDQDNALYVAAESGHWTLYRRQSGTSTSLGTVAQAPAAGDRVSIRLAGASVRVYVNDLAVINATETFQQTATHHGLGATIGGSGNSRWDAFRVTGLRRYPAFGIAFSAGRQAQVTESGNLKGSPRTYSVGDFWRIAVTFHTTAPVQYNVAYYFRPAGTPDWGDPWYTSTAHPDMQLDAYRTDVALYDAGASVGNLTIERYAANVFTDEASIATFGPWPADAVISDSSLDTYAKRAAHALAYFAQYAGLRYTYECTVKRRYAGGASVLFNATRLGLLNARKALIKTRVERNGRDAADWFYHLTLDAPPRLFGIRDPNRYLAHGPEGGTRPGPPTNLAQTGPGVPDATNTVSIVPVRWDPPAVNAQWIEVWALPVGAGEIVRARFPAGAQGGTLPLAFLRPYHGQARFWPYAGPPGGWCSPVDLVGGLPGNLDPDPPTLIAVTKCQQQPDGRYHIQVSLTPPDPAHGTPDKYEFRLAPPRGFTLLEEVPGGAATLVDLVDLIGGTTYTIDAIAITEYGGIEYRGQDYSTPLAPFTTPKSGPAPSGTGDASSDVAGDIAAGVPDLDGSGNPLVVTDLAADGTPNVTLGSTAGAWKFSATDAGPVALTLHPQAIQPGESRGVYGKVAGDGTAGLQLIITHAWYDAAGASLGVDNTYTQDLPATTDPQEVNMKQVGPAGVASVVITLAIALASGTANAWLALPRPVDAEIQRAHLGRATVGAAERLEGGISPPTMVHNWSFEKGSPEDPTLPDGFERVRNDATNTVERTTVAPLSGSYNVRITTDGDNFPGILSDYIPVGDTPTEYIWGVSGKANGAGSTQQMSLLAYDVDKNYIIGSDTNVSIAMGGSYTHYTHRDGFGGAGVSFVRLAVRTVSSAVARSYDIDDLLFYPAPADLGGDATGHPDANTVVAIQGKPVSAAAPSVNDLLIWSGTAWVPGQGLSLTTVLDGTEYVFTGGLLTAAIDDAVVSGGVAVVEGGVPVVST